VAWRVRCNPPFRRALEHDNTVHAAVTAREIGRVTIAEALEWAWIH
jgi:hypothetical protein